MAKKISQKEQSEKEQAEQKVKAAYKAEQKKRIAALRAGSKDYSGNEINRVFVRASEYVLYEVKTNILSESLKVYIDTEEETDTRGVIKNFNAIRGRFAEFKTVLFKVQDPHIARSRGANIIAQGLSGNIEEANEQFDIYIRDINEHYSNQFKFRMRYLITALAFVLTNISISVFIYLSKDCSQWKQIETFIYISAAGSMGGFLSIARRLDQTFFEKEVTKYMFNIYAIERIFIAIFAASIIYFAVQSNLAFGLVAKLQRPLVGYILFAVVAGFSETLVPNLLIKLESK